MRRKDWKDHIIVQLNAAIEEARRTLIRNLQQSPTFTRGTNPSLWFQDQRECGADSTETQNRVSCI